MHSLPGEKKRDQETCAPLTSFDWNDAEPNIIGTASIDTTCTIWDLNVRAHCSESDQMPDPTISSSSLETNSTA